jgi:hypothetical protein
MHIAIDPDAPADRPAEAAGPHERALRTGRREQGRLSVLCRVPYTRRTEHVCVPAAAGILEATGPPFQSISLWLRSCCVYSRASAFALHVRVCACACVYMKGG